MTANTGHIRRILLIDDDKSVIRTMQHMLQRNGFTVHAVSHGRLGLKCLENEQIDLLITDIYMDEMDGMEIVTKVKARFPKIKIIVMSGGSPNISMNVLPVAKILGADRTLPKPTDSKTLLAVIAGLDAEMAG